MRLLVLACFIALTGISMAFPHPDGISFEKAFCQYGINGKGKVTGDYQHPRHCGKFITCNNFEHGTTKKSKVLVRKCPVGLFFNDQSKVCVWPGDYKCFVYQGETCYGTKGNSFGIFKATQKGPVGDIKLYSYSGYVTCNKEIRNVRSLWGCNNNAGKNRVNTWITDKKNKSLFPYSRINKYGTYNLIGYNQLSPFIELNADPYKTYIVNKGEELRIWYGEDLYNTGEEDNAGRHCVDVYVHYEYYFPHYYLNQ